MGPRSSVATWTITLGTVHQPGYTAKLAQATGDITTMFRTAHPRPS